MSNDDGSAYSYKVLNLKPRTRLTVTAIHPDRPRHARPGEILRYYKDGTGHLFACISSIKHLYPDGEHFWYEVVPLPT